VAPVLRFGLFPFLGLPLPRFRVGPLQMGRKGRIGRVFSVFSDGSCKRHSTEDSMDLVCCTNQGCFFRHLNAQFPQKKMGSFKPIENKEGKCVKKMPYTLLPQCFKNLISFVMSCKARIFKICIQKLYPQTCILKIGLF